MDKLVLCGVEVSAQELVVACSVKKDQVVLRRFANTAGGHRALLRTLTRGGKRVRVVMEATGLYGLDVALLLSAHPGVQLMVANPRAVRDFAKAMIQRSKSGPLDARMLRSLQRESEQLRAEAQRYIAADDQLQRKYQLLCSATGFAENSAIQMLGELAMLPADRDVRQWVAFAGLDPREHSSGTSVHKRPRISKMGNRHLRHVLFMPALVAVARKLLHAIYGMFRSGKPYDGARVYQLPSSLPTPLAQHAT